MSENYIQPVLSRKFKSHLDISDKVFFSGSYGMGKTTYLKKVFDKDEGELNAHYLTLHLYPVNYSVADNKDIFELIKYDLLYQLMLHLEPTDLHEIDSSIYKSNFAQFLAENYGKLFFSFCTLLPKIGGSIEKIKDKLEELKKEFDKIENESTTKKLKSFIDEFPETKGSIYESDFYTNLICVLVQKLKNKHAKEIVLVIDDLDRIDPQHIFRILNVFSAHIDYDHIKDEIKNKFNIDKVIVVGDYNNIKNIFHHIYGAKTDFKGFMDKFYSHEIFEYSFEDKLSDLLYRKFLNKDDYIVFCLLKLILVVLFENQKFNLRQLGKIDKLLKENSNSVYDNFISILYKIYGNDKRSLKESIEECKELEKFSRLFEEYNQNFLAILVEKAISVGLEHNSEQNEKTYSITINEKPLTFTKQNAYRETQVTLLRNDFQIWNINDFWKLFELILEKHN